MSSRKNNECINSLVRHVFYNVECIQSVPVRQSGNKQCIISANHVGWFEFRLCPHNDPSTPVSQDCLDRYLLPLADGSGTRFKVTNAMRKVDIKLALPPGLTCTQCFLQWKYNAGEKL